MRRDRVAVNAQVRAQEGADQLPFPFAQVLVRLIEFDVALDELGKRQIRQRQNFGAVGQVTRAIVVAPCSS